MRLLLLALMIALLPLRGWVGDAMAMELMAATLQSTEDATDLIAHHPNKTRANTEFDAQPEELHHAECPGHAAMTGTPADSQHHADGANGSDCATCAACQICHTIALTPMTLHIASAALPARLPQASSHHFSSAERATGFKPPIF